MTAKAVPDGYHTITPYLVVREAARLIGVLESWIATHVEDVSPDEMKRRTEEALAGGGHS